MAALRTPRATASKSAAPDGERRPGAQKSAIAAPARKPTIVPAAGRKLSVDDLRALIREIPDFPKPGILFYDITTLLKDAEAFRRSVDLMTEPFLKTAVDAVVGMESRGFIFAAPMAYRLGVGFVPVRKLEYGTNTLEIHKDAIGKGERVLIVDDLLATGGTVTGTIELVRRLGGEVVGLGFLVELMFLKGRDRLKGYDVRSVIQY